MEIIYDVKKEVLKNFLFLFSIYQPHKKKLTPEQIKEIQNRMSDRKTNATALAKEYGISRGLLYQVLKA